MVSAGGLVEKLDEFAVLIINCVMPNSRELWTATYFCYKLCGVSDFQSLKLFQHSPCCPRCLIIHFISFGKHCRAIVRPTMGASFNFETRWQQVEQREPLHFAKRAQQASSSAATAAAASSTTTTAAAAAATTTTTCQLEQQYQLWSEQGWPRLQKGKWSVK